jgi:hypothetical protein
LSSKDIFPEWNETDCERYICKRRDAVERVQVFRLTRTLPSDQGGPDIAVNAVVEIAECESFKAACESIVRALANRTRVYVPTNEAIGAVCLSSLGVSSSWFFARGNVMGVVGVALSPLKPSKQPAVQEALSTMAKELCAKVDSRIIEIPEVEIGKSDDQSIKNFALVDSQVHSAGKELQLQLELAEPLNDNMELKICPKGGEVFRKGQDYYYRAEGAGKHPVSVYLMKSGKVASHRQILVNVEQ